jgi:predicted acylesterase/phospholipase RssA/CRP-like cAMP-binding protein
LQDQLEWLHLSNGDVLFRQGDAPDGMYIVVNGLLRITVTTPTGKDEVLGEIGRGETVGEFALMTDEVRTATIYVARETNVVRITPPVFKRLVRRYPELMGKIAGGIVKRQQRILEPILKGIKRPSPAALTMALLPASSTVDTSRFAQELASALALHGPARALSSQQFDEAYGQPGASQSEPDDAANPAIVAWMAELEASNKYLLYVAGFAPSAWTRRCIGQADRVLIIADPRGDPAPGAAERMLEQLEVPVRTELVLWHPTGTKRPQGTSAWLDVRQVHTHHHLRRGDQGHMARLARRLTGNAIALAFSGGGARGWAHAGVHRAMEELNIPVDYVGGTSMGAVMGGTLHLSESNAELMRRAARFSHPKVLFDYTLPFTSLMASHKMTRFTQDMYGDLLIEDHWHSFFCVACNLRTAESVVFQRGLLWRAVRASLATPGVWTPVMEDGDLLVDGGVMDNFPVRLLADLSESERIIGVQVNPERETRQHYDLDTGISGWHILHRRINPFLKPLRSPPIIGIIMRALQVGTVRRSKTAETLVDLLITPDVKHFGFLDFAEHEAIAQIGYEAALEPLRKWKEKQLFL